MASKALGADYFAVLQQPLTSRVIAQTPFWRIWGEEDYYGRIVVRAFDAGGLF